MVGFGGGAVRTSSLPDSDAVREATMAVLLWRAHNSPRADREMGSGEGRMRNLKSEDGRRDGEMKKR